MQDVLRMDVHGCECLKMVRERMAASLRLTQAGCDKLRQAAAAWM